MFKTSPGRTLTAPDRHPHCEGCLPAVVIDGGRFELAHEAGCPVQAGAPLTGAVPTKGGAR
ncbi:hypothetical protein Aple_034280 [Acrocarpospora pleiomorpha]|uniref:Uncharacterized protein n=1 Tax=Acrocarpospora pleiomorpha TaxID=90975 RepID=A0A5M3XIE1_9ACTN|nr:hypothetical protein Aple_034280 [Acrocarpospora pleiomorpha]